MADRLEPMFMINGIFPAYSVVQPNFSLDSITENIAYILDAKGWKIFKKNAVSRSLTEIPAIDGFPKFDESIHLIAEKIPLNLIRRVTAFFAAVYKRSKSEAVGYLYYNTTSGEWDFIPPIQTASGASANYESAPQKEGWLVAGTIHSHANMSAFHSGTDVHDEQYFDGIHITIGKLADVPEYSCSIVAQGVRAKFEDISLLIDGMVSENEVPQGWMEAVKHSEPAAKYLKDKNWGGEIEDIWQQYLKGEIKEKKYLKLLDKYIAKIDDEEDEPLIDVSKGNGKQESFLDNQSRFRGLIRHYGRWDY